MPELMHTVEAMHRVEKRKQKFMAALQGIDLDKEETPKNSKAPTAEEVKARAVARLTGDRNLAGAVAEGFTPDTGLIYKIVDGAEIG
jgi:hypothetical protein